MNKYFFILVVVLSHSLQAQDTTAIDLSTVSVTANITATDLRKTARSVSVIDAKAIADAPVRSLAGILQYALNIDVRSRGPMGVQSDISIRGGHFDQTLILVDGIKMNDPQTGHHSMNIPVPIEMIQKIEVLQGGASRVYGPAAFAGVILITTKKKLSESVRANFAVGEHQLLRTSIQGGFQKSIFRSSANFEHIQSSGHAYNTAFEKYNAHVMVDFDLKKGFVNIQAGQMKNDFGAANFYFPSFYDQAEVVSSTFVAAQWYQNYNNQFSGTVLASYRRHNDVYDFNNFSETNLSNVNFHQSDVFAFEWKGRYLSDWGATAIGAEIRQEGIVSNRLGELLARPKPVKSFKGVFYDKGFQRRNASLFVEQQKSLGKLYIASGALFNYNNQFGFQFYPGMDFSYELGDNTSVYASVNRSLRFPTFTEMYLNTNTVEGNPNLKAEKALFYELGFKQKGTKNSWSLATFYKNGEDAIDKIKRPELSRPTMENIDDVNFIGIESIYSFQIGKWIERIDLNYAFLRSNQNEDGFQSFYTLNYLTHKFSSGFNFRVSPSISLQTWYTFKDRKGAYQFTSKDALIPYESVHLVDLRLSYAKGKLRSFVDINNVMGYEYFEFGFVEQPGRWLSVGVSYGI